MLTNVEPGTDCTISKPERGDLKQTLDPRVFVLHARQKGEVVNYHMTRKVSCYKEAEKGGSLTDEASGMAK